jgi:hypothetical protein
VALTETFDSARSSFVLNAIQLAFAQKEENTVAGEGGIAGGKGLPLFIPGDEDQSGDGISARAQDTITIDRTTNQCRPYQYKSSCQGASYHFAIASR